MDYKSFIARKRTFDEPSGLSVVHALSPMLYDFQRDITSWSLRRGRAAIFADCGMGKTPMQLEWANHIPGRVLIVSPLAVSSQTVAEACKFGVSGCAYLRADDGKTRIVVTNYEMIHHFNPADFAGIVLDESSILKSYDGAFRTMMIDTWGAVPFRLAATATPAPNDFMELGSHAEWLGVMTRTEMLSQFFVHDGGETQTWRLKGHAESEFWRWLCSWAVMIRKPSDIGYDDGAFRLPPLHIEQVTVTHGQASDGMLFKMDAVTLQERQAARRSSIAARVDAVADLVNGSRDPWLVWCDLNAESEALCRSIPDAVEVRGSDSIEIKESRISGFSRGAHRVLVTKPSIAGYGMNWQHCAHMAFTGLSDSYELFYQAVRRAWRFGQKRDVRCYVVTECSEGAVVKNIQRKERDAARMAAMMVEHMSYLSAENIRGSARQDKSYNATIEIERPAFV